MKEIKGCKGNLVTLPDGTRINYYSGGPENGRPVVLLHGGGTDHAMLSWRDTLPALINADCRVYAPDCPGYGNSPPDSNKKSTTENQINYLEGLIEVWGLKQADLIGISMGGSLALGYALKNPKQIKRLVLIGSYGLQDKAPSHHLSYLCLKMPWLNDLMWLMTRNLRLAAKYGVNYIIRNPQSRTESLVDEVIEAMRNENSQKAFSQWQQDEVRWDHLKTNYTSRLSEIKVPVLLVHGTHDFLVPIKYAKRAAPLFKNARLEVFNNAGHWTHRDYPEQFNEMLIEFLEA